MKRKSEAAGIRKGAGCPLCTPLGLALFLVGFMVVFYVEWPLQIIGWLLVAAAYLKGLLGVRSCQVGR